MASPPLDRIVNQHSPIFSVVDAAGNRPVQILFDQKLPDYIEAVSPLEVGHSVGACHNCSPTFAFASSLCGRYRSLQLDVPAKRIKIRLGQTCREPVFRYRRGMPKGRPINDPKQDEAIYAAQQTGETMASIAGRLGINRWNVNDACKRVRSRRRLEAHRAEFADWREVPIAYLGLSTRARDAIHAMRIATSGALYSAIETEGNGLFKYAPSVGRVTISEILAWYNTKLGE